MDPPFVPPTQTRSPIMKLSVSSVSTTDASVANFLVAGNLGPGRLVDRPAAAGAPWPVAPTLRFMLPIVFLTLNN